MWHWARRGSSTFEDVADNIHTLTRDKDDSTRYTLAMIGRDIEARTITGRLDANLGRFAWETDSERERRAEQERQDFFGAKVLDAICRGQYHEGRNSSEARNQQPGSATRHRGATQSRAN